MNDKYRRNRAASVRDRLLALARERGEDFQSVLIQYGRERLLYRLSKSKYKDRFVLKGAMLFMLWSDQLHRPTLDIDLLGSGESSEEALSIVFRELCVADVEDDGLTLMVDSIRTDVIRGEMEYAGIRVKLAGSLAGARIPIQADIGFGDAVTPDAKEIDYPTLLDNPAPRLRAYPRETVVAEKYQALVNLGIVNSRMKDFYDLWFIAHNFDFDGTLLVDAIRNTFSRRGTSVPEHTPSGLSAEFYESVQKNAQWNAFLQRGMLMADPPLLANVCSFLGRFLLPPSRALVLEQDFAAKWKPGGPWH